MERSLRIETLTSAPVARRRIEVVERKGLGHPDTICDSIAEAVSRELCGVYLELAGRVLHHNVDKALLVAGVSEPRLGGGRVLEPMRLILGDRATDDWEGHTIPVAEIAEAAAVRWMREHLRDVDPEQHLRVESALRPGSAQLSGLFAEDRVRANDTSVGVGCAPLTETEELVLTADRVLHAPAFRELFPEAGEDVKVMAVRNGGRLEFTVAVAFVDRWVPSEGAYFDRKAALRSHLREVLASELSGSTGIASLGVTLNALDREGRGEDGLYLTVLGTSAEGADSGEVGRGNRVNGLITFQRPLSLEAAAGKNPVSHVGKIYNLLAHHIATSVHAEVVGVEEVRVLLASRIGHPIEEPWIASVQLCPCECVTLADVADDVEAVVQRELAATPEFLTRLVREGMPVC